jgi:hypothetical protein
MELFKDHKNKWSSKRILGALLLFICVGLVFVDTFTRYQVNDFLFGTMFGGSITLLGVESVVNGINNGRNQRHRHQGSNGSEELDI